MAIGQRLSVRQQAPNERFSQFHRKTVSMEGPQTDELVQSGKIITPYPGTICTRRFPLRPRNEEVLSVIIPNLDNIEELGLSHPTFEQTIRFVSQLKPGDGHKGKTLVFPSEPPFSGDVLPPEQCWLTLVWRPARGLSELCLYFMERSVWPENTEIVGFTAL
jgi:hypothetical protein